MFLIGAKTDDTLTAAQELQGGKGFGLGERFMDSEGREWAYVSASAAIAAFDVVTMTAAHAAAPLGTANDARGNLAAVAPVAFASADRGWVQVRGAVANVNVLASAAANVRLNTTATAGSLDDDGTVGSMHVQGIYLTTARGAGAGPAPAILNYPYVDATL
jgi:hypothetical protein